MYKDIRKHSWNI